MAALSEIASGSSRRSTGLWVIIETNSVKTMYSSSTPPSAESVSTDSISGVATALASAYDGLSEKPVQDCATVRSRKP